MNNSLSPLPVMFVLAVALVDLLGVSSTWAQSSRTELKSKGPQIAAGVQAAETVLTPGQLAAADLVHTGVFPCELGQTVTVRPDPKGTGHFDLRFNSKHYRMVPIETSTGAVRLENKAAGLVWIQVANKSMLMNQKLGQRVTDDCVNPAQAAVAAALLKAPNNFLEPATAQAASVLVAPIAPVAPSDLIDR